MATRSLQLLRRPLKMAARRLSGAVWSCNEWDPLEEIVVGRSEFAVVPPLTPEVRACLAPSMRSFYESNAGRYWADALPTGHWEKVQQEVQELCRLLEAEGVTVKRPDAIDWAKEYQLPEEENAKPTKGLYSAMPRDSLLVVGDEIIESNMVWRSRYFEYVAYRRLIVDYWRGGAVWTAVPKTSPIDGLIVPDESEEFATTETEPCFDAADFVRAGRDIFGQRSHVTNMAGIEWLRRHLQPKGVRVHCLKFNDTRPMHIDASLCLIRPGLALQNPDRPLLDDKMFKEAGWDIVDCPQPAEKPKQLLLMASSWLSMNTIMLDEKRVLIEKDELPQQRLYEKLGVECVRVAMRHCHTLGGGIHCWTSDIRRRGTMESYF